MKPKCEKCNDTGSLPGSDFYDCSCEAADKRIALNDFVSEIRQKGFTTFADLHWSIHQRAVAQSAERIAELERQVAEMHSGGTRDRVRDAIAAALGEAMDCTRVWSAWGHGSMRESDFSVVANDDDRLEEIVDAALGAILAAKEQA